MPSSDSEPSCSPSPSPSSSVDKIASLEHQLQERTQQLVNATSAPKRKVTTQTQGRGIRRLVSCFDNVMVIIGEADRRMLPAEFDDPSDSLSSEEHEELTRTRDRLFTAFTLLVRLIPQISDILKEPDLSVLTSFASRLQDGANSARSDDMTRIRGELVSWLSKYCHSDNQLDAKSHTNRGLQHDVCGELLSPIEVEWNDPEVCANIRNGTSTFNINDSFFLRCLYPNSKGNPECVEDGFLRSHLLLMTYKAIFTSTSFNTDEFTGYEDNPNAPPSRNSKPRKAMRANVASLLKMGGMVTGRSIAYAAVILVFNLTDAIQWTETYNGFSFHAFYNFLIDYFEDAPNPTAQ